MATFNIPNLYPKQLEFISSKSRFTGYGGARGGGKSYVARILAAMFAIKYWGIQILLLRRSFPELNENHIVPLIKLLKAKDPNTENRVAVYKTAEKVFEFTNGSRIKMGYCDSEQDVLQYQGQSYDVILMEEATQFSEFQFNCLMECNRLSGNITNRTFKPQMFFTANPGGIGMQWFKRLFIDKNYLNQEREEDYTMIRSQVYDNLYIMENDPEYVRMLQNLPDKRRRAMLDGDWDVFEGQYFEEFDRDIHVCKPFAIPKNWRVYRARDYGLDMLACYWVAIDNEGFAYVYKELYESGLIVSEAGKKINDMTTEPIWLDLVPPDLYNRNAQTGKSAVDIWREECSQFVTKASNDRINGWYAVKEWLNIKIDTQGNKRPKLTIFENCPNLIRCIPQLIHDATHYEDVANNPHEITHAPDALRYFCSSWTYPPEKENVMERTIYDSLPFSFKPQTQKKGGYIEW